jgi:FkbM family methyltransferase
VFDVGANVGEYTGLMSKLVGPTGAVYAFEPNPAIWGLFEARVSTRNVHLQRHALSDSVSASCAFFVDVREGMLAVASSLNHLDGLHAAGQARAISVPTTTIDAFCLGEHVTPDLIKIDVEGHELQVIRGAAETLNRCRPILVFEFWETWWDRGVRLIFDFLRDHYRLVRLQDGETVNDFYYSQCRDGCVDIACLPRADKRAQALDAALLRSDRADAHASPVERR